jgi:hypothetical protein
LLPAKGMLLNIQIIKKKKKKKKGGGGGSKKSRCIRLSTDRQTKDEIRRHKVEIMLA